LQALMASPFSPIKNPNTQMTFVDHLESLRWHILRCAIVLICAAIIAFIFNSWIFNHIILGPTKSDFVSYKILCWLGNHLHIPGLCMQAVKIEFLSTELSGQFMLSFSSSFTMALIIAAPYVFWEIWRFVKPALTPYELKNSTSVIFWFSFLFFFGVAFGYFIIAPYTINFFSSFQISDQIQNKFKVNDYLDTLISLTLGTGLVFELPVFVYFLSKVGILTPKFMKDTRRYAIVIILFLAAIITPPDVFSMIIVTIPLVLLYELSIKISGRVQKVRIKKEKEFFSSTYHDTE
jgi:sec-independent protein translocase protein TatC